MLSKISQKTFVFSLCVLVFSVFASGQKPELRNDLKNSLKKFDLVRLNSRAALRKAEAGDSILIPAGGKSFQLNLTPRDLRTANYKAEETTSGGKRRIETSPVTTFKGTIAGESSSEVRLTIDDAKIEGYFIDANGEKFFIEPAKTYSRLAGAEDFVVYQEKDFVQTEEFVCHSELAGKIESGKEIVNANRPENFTQIRVIEIATEADFSFVTLLGGAAQANNEILGILNMIEGEYETQLGLSFDVVFQHAWSIADPYNGAAATPFLNSFQSYWNANFPRTNYPRDTAHLFTARTNFSGQGMSFFGVICSSPNSAYGFTGRLDFGLIKYVLTAHEIAHNLGATHAEVTQGCANTVMNSVVSNLTPIEFCPVSRTEVGNFVGINNSCLSVRAVRNTAFDFDGDGKADIAVFRPSNGAWYLNRSAAGFTGMIFGISTDKIAAGDYDGDGKTDIAVYRNGIWYLQRSQLGFTGISFGTAEDIPVPADYDGDGKTDIAVFRPSNGTWYLLRSSQGFTGAAFGQAGDKPVPADYDGDGKADLAVYRNGTWYLMRSQLGFTGAAFGEASDKPAPADYDGDGKADIAVFRPSNGTWYIQGSQVGFTGISFGMAEDIPAPADYDGDGRADVAVFRPSNGTWYLQRSRSGFMGAAFGASEDKPISGVSMQ